MHLIYKGGRLFVMRGVCLEYSAERGWPKTGFFREGQVMSTQKLLIGRSGVPKELIR